MGSRKQLRRGRRRAGLASRERKASGSPSVVMEKAAADDS